MSSATLRQTPLYHVLKASGGRFVEFGGWDMPVQFTGILAEHAAVRNAAGVFDISHMGQVWLSGRDSLAFLQKVMTNDFSALVPGMGLYTLMCRPDGGVIDDLYVFCLEPERYLLIVNASRTPIDLQWMQDQASGDVSLFEQPQAAAVALQGPQSAAILQTLFPNAAGLPRNGAGEFEFKEALFVVTRTGYTGEDGFEIFAPAGHIYMLFPSLLEMGKAHGLVLAGLGCRDTLRLEMGYRLYGQDMDEQHTGLEAGLGWTIKMDKKEFIGKEAFAREKAKGSARKLVGFKLKERGIARHGHPFLYNGQPVGEVTSGTLSPTLNVGIGMAYVESMRAPATAPGAGGFSVKVHERLIPVEIVQMPFYKKP
jgi:aminomethyltransferase